MRLPGHPSPPAQCPQCHPKNLTQSCDVTPLLSCLQQRIQTLTSSLGLWGGFSPSSPHGAWAFSTLTSPWPHQLCSTSLPLHTLFPLESCVTSSLFPWLQAQVSPPQGRESSLPLFPQHRRLDPTQGTARWLIGPSAGCLATSPPTGGKESLISHLHV